MADNVIKIKNKNRDEYLTLLQAAFLISQSEQNTLTIVKSGKMQSVKWKNKIFIPIDSLENYVCDVIGQYYEALVFLDLPDDQKADYLKKILPAAYRGRSHNPAESLTVIQTAYLIKRSRQAVYDLIRKGILKSIRGSRTTLIPIEDFAAYIVHKLTRIRPAMIFLEEDSFSFWSKNTDKYEKFYQENLRKGGSKANVKV